MTSELNPATALGSGIQTMSGGQSPHLQERLQRRVLLQTFADCGCPFSADFVVSKAAGAETRE